MLSQRPNSRLQLEYENLGGVCETNCHCANVAPETPKKTAVAVRQPPLHTSLPDFHPGFGGERGNMDYHWDYCICNEAWYGRPNVIDCFGAIQQLPDYHSGEDLRREFLGLTGPHPHPAPGLDGPPLHTPIMIRQGM